MIVCVWLADGEPCATRISRWPGVGRVVGRTVNEVETEPEVRKVRLAVTSVGGDPATLAVGTFHGLNDPSRLLKVNWPLVDWTRSSSCCRPSGPSVASTRYFVTFVQTPRPWSGVR